MSQSSILSHFTEAQAILNQFTADAANMERISQAAEVMVTALKNGKKIISCGNGGSMCDAMHFAEELSGKYRNDRPAIAALSISDASHISCVGNDYGYAYIFSRYVEALGQPGDVLVGFSSSGNSENIVNALNTAKQKGLTTVCLTGKTGGKMAPLADIEIRAPHSQYADRAQEIHIKVIHALIDSIEEGMGFRE